MAAMRKITSLTAFLSFFMVLLTSVVLYITPQGRVAYWADWRLLGLSKEQWGAIHINVGFLFLMSLSLHLYYNWSPIVFYLKNKTKQLRVFTREFNVALAVTVLFILGTYFEIPPFATILRISDDLKVAAAKKYGEPPYGHAELSSLVSFSQKVGLDWQAGMAALQKAGYRVDRESQTLKEIAQNNQVPPQRIYAAMTPAAAGSTAESGTTSTLPETPEPGTGNLTLAEFCDKYHLNPDSILQGLQALNISANRGLTVKKIAEINRSSPLEVYEKIKSIGAKSNKQ